MKYEKPELEELDLILEGSFLASKSPNEKPDVPVDPTPGEGDEWD